MRPGSLATDPAAALRERLCAVRWEVLRTDHAAGAYNMALDAALLSAAAAEAIPPTLRFYGWSPPAVSLGRFQRPDGIALAAASARGWELVRRPTGGRAVLHDRELTYSLVLPPSVLQNAGVRTSYAVLVGCLNAGLRRLLGSAAAESPAPGTCGGRARAANCFALPGECDTLVPEGKLVGSAQVRRDGALLQHGSLLLDADRGAWSALFGEPGRLVTLADLLGAPPHPDAAAAALLSGFAAAGIRFREQPLPEPLERAALSSAAEYVLPVASDRTLQ
ncbi:MAG: biotin/lipoate A/B protein ligase family protein [Armatimonadota bacterium]